MSGEVLLYVLLMGSVNISEIARVFGVTVNTIWRKVRRLREENRIIEENGKLKLLNPRLCYREVALYVLSKCRCIDDLVRLIAKIRKSNWCISGTYALFHYDALYLTPPQPPILLILVNDKQLLQVYSEVIAPLAKLYGVEPLVKYSSRFKVSPEPPPLLEEVPVAILEQAVIDALEYSWSGEENLVLSLQAFYRFSSRVEDYVKLIELAKEMDRVNALKLMNLASGIVKEITGSTLWYEVYMETLKALNGKPVKPRELARKQLMQLRFALTSSLLTNGAYTKLTSSYVYNGRIKHLNKTLS